MVIMTSISILPNVMRTPPRAGWPERSDGQPARGRRWRYCSVTLFLCAIAI
jgi:hypothetical protein